MELRARHVGVQLVRLVSQGRVWLVRRQVNVCLAIETPATTFARSCYPANRPHTTYYCTGSLVHGIVTHGGARPGASRLDLISLSQAVAACRVSTVPVHVGFRGNPTPDECRCTHHDADRSTEHASSHDCMHLGADWGCSFVASRRRRPQGGRRQVSSWLPALHPRLAQLHGCCGMLMAQLQAPHAQHCRLALGLQSARTSRAPKRAGRAAHRCCRLHTLHPRLAQLHGCSGMLMAQLQAHHAHRLTSTWHLAVQLAGPPPHPKRSRGAARSSGALYCLASHPLGCSAQWQHPHA